MGFVGSNPTASAIDINFDEKKKYMIIFINGTINSGKSTVAKLLQKRIPKAAVVEVDALREFIDWLPLEQAIPINLKNAVSVVKNFVSEDLNVILPYPLSEKNYEFFAKELATINQKLTFITLAPQLEKVLENRGVREVTEQEKQRIRYHYDNGLEKPRFGTIIDNSNQTPEQTVEEILKKL